MQNRRDISVSGHARVVAPAAYPRAIGRHTARTRATAAPAVRALALAGPDYPPVAAAACHFAVHPLAGRHDRPGLRLHFRPGLRLRFLPGCRDHRPGHPSRQEVAGGDYPGHRSNSPGQGLRNIRHRQQSRRTGRPARHSHNPLRSLEGSPCRRGDRLHSRHRWRKRACRPGRRRNRRSRPTKRGPGL